MSERRWRGRSIVLLGIAIGGAAGIAGWGFLTTQRLLGDRIVFMGRHALWMKPLIEILLCMAAGTVALAIARLRGRRDALPAASFAYVFLGAASLLFLLPPLHPIARVVLAAGCATVAARLAPRAGPRSERASVAAGWTVASLALALAVGSIATTRLRERASLASLPDAAVGAPNVLLVILDTVRASSLSAYGNPRPTTPTLESFAGEGVRFEHAIAPAPWTLPSHAAMFTGHLPHELSADWRVPLDGTYPTLAERLADAGYATAGFVANMGYCGWESGLQRGFARWEDHPISLRQLIASSPLLSWLATHPRVREWLGSDENFVRKRAPDVRGEFLAWLDGRPDGRPFFAFLNYYDAHGPYEPPEPYASRLAVGTPRGGLSPLHRWNSDPFGPPPGVDEIARERAAYEGSIASLDADLGRLLAALDERGLRENTIVIIAADHGEEFGEHGVFDHGNSLYEESLHVPLLIRWPARVPAGRVVGTTASLVRLGATVTDLVGLGGTAALPGASLAPLWGPAAIPDTEGHVLSEVSHAPRLPDWFPVSKGDMASLMGARWHYIRNGDGTEELYDRAGARTRDVVASGPDEEARAALRSLRSEMDARRPDLAPAGGSAP